MTVKEDEFDNDRNSIFCTMVDLLVQLSENDPELADGIKWIDAQAQKDGVSFYDKTFEVLHKHDIKIKAKDWLNSRN